MANNIPSLDRLIDSFTSLPGVGKKSASRFAYCILDMNEEDAVAFARSILEAKANVHQCPVCHNLTDSELCSICSDDRRDRSTLCVVEGPRDVNSIERTHEYSGMYHVLGGLISPMEGVTPADLHIADLIARLADGTVTEVILATNPTVEGETTAAYISRMIKPLGVKVTRLATGLPIGGSMEYADETTIYRALENRQEI